MRTYPRNSPQAAARIVALAMLADGHLCKAELDAIARLSGYDTLGLDPEQWHTVMHTFCEDLLAAAHANWSDACRIDSDTLDSLLAEIDDPELQRKVLQLCAAVVEADSQFADTEAVVMSAAVEQWGLQRELLRNRAAPMEASGA